MHACVPLSPEWQRAAPGVHCEPQTAVPDAQPDQSVQDRGGRSTGHCPQRRCDVAKHDCLTRVDCYSGYVVQPAGAATLLQPNCVGWAAPAELQSWSCSTSYQGSSKPDAKLTCWPATWRSGTPHSPRQPKLAAERSSHQSTSAVTSRPTQACGLPPPLPPPVRRRCRRGGGTLSQLRNQGSTGRSAWCLTLKAGDRRLTPGPP